MMGSKRNPTEVLVLMGLLAVVLSIPGVGLAQDIRYEGSYVLAPNGDMAVTINLTPPMVVYQKLRESMSNLYLVMRGFSENRADAEVVDKKAEWDDSNRTLHFSMKMLGAGRNLGDRWQVKIEKPTDFSNLDESKMTFYFNESLPTPAGTIRGISKLVLPPEARQLKWDEPHRVVSYVMPIAGGGAASIFMLWVAASILVVVGVGLLAASIVVKPPSMATQAPSE
jgi:hypothetical protein